MIRTTAFIFLLAFSIPAAAQVSEPGAESAYPPPNKGRQPNIPGTFVVELGINGAPDAPERFDLGAWGSRTINIYYTYELQVLQSKFSVVPGIGLSLERFKFKNGATLGYRSDSLKLLIPSESGILGLRKSHLVTNYIDIPVELRFTSNPSDPNRAFKAAIGGRVGYLYDSFSKIKYKVEGETRHLKDKQSWNLTQFRYGVYAKLGIGNFSLFGYYNLTPLFEDDKGLSENNVMNDFKTFTVGFSLSAF